MARTGIVVEFVLLKMTPTGFWKIIKNRVNVFYFESDGASLFMSSEMRIKKVQLAVFDDFV